MAIIRIADAALAGRQPTRLRRLRCPFARPPPALRGYDPGHGRTQHSRGTQPKRLCLDYADYRARVACIKPDVWPVVAAHVCCLFRIIRDSDGYQEHQPRHQAPSRRSLSYLKSDDPSEIAIGTEGVVLPGTVRLPAPTPPRVESRHGRSPVDRRDVFCRVLRVARRADCESAGALGEIDGGRAGHRRASLICPRYWALRLVKHSRFAPR